jgi:hypothetical protein
MPDAGCPERVQLSKAVVAAIAEVSCAAEAYDTAKRTGTANLSHLVSVLMYAREAERSARRAFDEHIKTHGGERSKNCKQHPQIHLHIRSYQSYFEVSRSLRPGA